MRSVQKLHIIHLLKIFATFYLSNMTFKIKRNRNRREYNVWLSKLPTSSQYLEVLPFTGCPVVERWIHLLLTAGSLSQCATEARVTVTPSFNDEAIAAHVWAAAATLMETFTFPHDAWDFWGLEAQNVDSCGSSGKTFPSSNSAQEPEWCCTDKNK